MELHTQRIGNRRNIAVGIDSEIIPEPLLLPLIQRRRSKSLHCLRNQSIPCQNKIKRFLLSGQYPRSISYSLISMAFRLFLYSVYV